MIKKGMERAQRIDTKFYSLKFHGEIVVVGTTDDIAARFNTTPNYINKQLRTTGKVFGYDCKRATKKDVEVYNYQKVAKENPVHEPKKYKDASSARFTPL